MARTRSSPEIHFDVHGDVGPRVLLVMGLGMRGAMWGPQIEGLSRSHRVVTFDHRGIGQSASCGRWFSMKDLAADAERVLDEVGWADAHVVGTSMGGMVAQELVLRAPARVTSLVLIATHAGGPLAWLPPRPGIERFFRSRFGPRSERARAMTELLYPEAFIDSCDRAALRRRMAETTNPFESRTALMGQLRAVARFDARARLGGVDVPTLVVRPGRDYLIRPDKSDELARSIPRARLLRVDDAGHGIVYQCGTLLSQVIAEHVRATRRTRPGDDSR